MQKKIDEYYYKGAKLLSYLKEDYLARRVNKSVLNLTFYMVDFYYKLSKLKENRTVDDLVNDLISMDEIDTTYGLFPVDINLYNKDKYETDFIKKCADCNRNTYLPIYMAVADIQENGKYSPEYSFDDVLEKYVHLFINDNKITIYISSEIIHNLLNTGNLKYAVGVISHELQHAFDDNVVYSNFGLSSKFKCGLMNEFENDDCFGFDKDSVIGKTVRTYLYAISKEELQARRNEISSIISYLNLTEVQKNYNDMYSDYRKYGSFPEQYLMKTNKLVQSIATSDKIKDVVSVQFMMYAYKNFADFKKHRTTYKPFMKVLMICGYYMAKHRMFNLSFSNFVPKYIYDFFSRDNVENYVADKVTAVKYFSDLNKMLDFIYLNVLYIFCEFFNDIYNILYDRLDEFFDYYIVDEFDIRKSLTESVDNFVSAHEVYFFPMKVS